MIRKPEFKDAYRIIQNLYRKELAFKNSVREDASFFVERQREKGLLKLPASRAVGLSIRYLKEEFAIYLMLAEAGWYADFYLGDEISTLKKILGREIEGVPDALKKRVNISLQKKKKMPVAQQSANATVRQDAAPGIAKVTPAPVPASRSLL